MPKIERFKDGLVLCSSCKRYLPRESFFEWQLRKGKYDCKECHRKYANEYNHRHGVKSREEQIREREENRQKELDPFEEINFAVEKVTKDIGEYQEKEGHVCGYCDKESYVISNERKLCKIHFLIVDCLLGCKPLGKTIKFESYEFQRRLRILQNLEKLGVEI
jgi:hypothetical protein